MEHARFAAFTLIAAMAVAGPHAQRGQVLSPPTARPRVVEIRTTQIAPAFYRLDGQGAATGVLVGSDGAVIVDSMLASAAASLVAAVERVADGRLRILINTGVDEAHVGGNTAFGKLGVTIVGRESLRRRLQTGDWTDTNGKHGVPPAPAVGLPTATVEGRLSLHVNGEDIRLIPVPRAHTDSDLMVFFPKSDVLMTGDVYRSEGYPNIVHANGGSLQGHLAGLDIVLELAGPSTKIIPGHGPTVDRTAVAWHRDMFVDVRDKVAALVRQGLTLDQVRAAKPVAVYDGKIPQGAVNNTADRFVGQIYFDLTVGSGKP